MSDPWKIGRFYNSYATQEIAWTQEEKLKELECGFWFLGHGEGGCGH